MRSEPRVLVIDDALADVTLLQVILDDAGYHHVVTLTDPRRATVAYRSLKPDIILLDLHMPHLSGIEVIERLRPEIGFAFVPIVVLTADDSMDARHKALAAGAKDFLVKPFDEEEVRLRIANLLETRRLHVALHRQNRSLEATVRERTADLERAKFELLERLALACELRDDMTGRHTQRVGRLSALVAQAIGMQEDEVQLIRQAAPLHDIGKIATPDRILLKPRKLSNAEWRVMKRHSEIGARLLSNSMAPALQLAETIALTHHERWDGNGYAHMRGSEIPLAGRVVAIVDVFDALTNERPYKAAWPLEQAIDEIARQEGQQFEPAIVRAFLDVAERHDVRAPDEIDQEIVVDLSEAADVAATADALRGAPESF
ncbi:MAG: response regulator [Actinomycetota bacterium]|nr:response regulator [Actinomycetota bacterium]